MKESFRRKTSFVMLPVMLLYLISPSIGYAEAQVISTGSSSQEAFDKAALDEAANAAKELNKSNKGKGTLKGGDGSGASADNSNSSNSTGGVDAQVNPQNGQVDLNFNNIKLHGVTEDVALTLGLSNGGEKQSVYALPAGWKLNIDYIDFQEQKLYMTGGKSYYIDYDFSTADGYKSGLRYCTDHGTKFNSLGKQTPLPYNSNLRYAYTLSLLNGSIKYFDASGKLICLADRFGNNIIYTYYNPDASPYDTALKNVRGSYGQDQDIGIDTQGTVVKITMPDKRTAIYDFSEMFSNNLITVKDLTGRKTKIYVSHNGERVESILYPDGGQIRYSYSDNEIPYLVSGESQPRYFPAVVSELHEPGTPNNASDDMVTQYDYVGAGSKCFTGYPDVVYYDGDKSGGFDPLMESGLNNYAYTTTITNIRAKENGGDVYSKTNYNFLHLPLSSQLYQKGLLKQLNFTYNF